MASAARPRCAVPTALAVMALLAGPSATASTPPLPDGVTWDRAFWDPAPAEDGDDLVLPMPCGGAMAFRRIATPASADVWLDDRPFDLGFEATDDVAYSEYLRTDYIAGSFVDRGERVFYIGKYEVTRDQVATLGDGACPEPANAGRVPAHELTWFEAVEIGRRYTEWLLQTAPGALPSEDGAPAFLRLPTEPEWEFVARGGVRVGEQAFDDRLFPMDDAPLAAFAWYQGPESAAGRLKPVGMLRANPLGVFDLLGNVEEFVLEPFRMNRAGRFHGQRGGFFTKGGSILTPGTRMRTALRTEYSYFDETTGQATRLDTFGMRLLISAPVATSVARLEAIRRSWEEVPRVRLDTVGLDPIDALGEVAQSLEDALVRESLEDIEARLDEELAAAAERAGAAEQERARSAALMAAAEDRIADLETGLASTAAAVAEVEAALRRELGLRNEAEDAALRALITSGAFIMRKLRDDHRRFAGFAETLAGIDALLVRAPDDPALSAQREDLAGAVAARREVFRISEDAYFAVLRDTGRSYSEDALANQLPLVVQRLDALYAAERQDPPSAAGDPAVEPHLRLSAFARLFAAQAGRYGRGGAIDQAALLEEILAF